MKATTQTNAAAIKKPSPGAILVITLCAMITGSLCMNKVSPVLTQITQSLNITNPTQAGMLISVFVFSGIILAVPIGVIITRMGAYKTGLIALAASLVGSVIGAFPVCYPVLLLGRIVEGIGLIFLATIGPAVVGRAFPDKNRGAAIGFLMCFMAFGQIIIFNLAPRIAVLSSWRSIWWVTAAWSCVMFVVCVLSLRYLDQPALDAEAGGKDDSLKAVIRNPDVWLLGITLALFLIGQQGIIGFLTNFLETKGVDGTIAGSMVSIASFVGLPVGVLAGFVADRVGSRKYPMLVLLIGSAAVYFFMPSFSMGIYAVIIILFGVTTMGVVGLCFSSVPDVIDKPEHANMAISIVNMFQWIGIFLSSILFGAVLNGFGWNAAFYAMAAVAVLAGLSIVVNKRVK